MSGIADRIQDEVLAGQLPEEVLLSNPFALVAQVLGRALAETKPYRGTGELGPDGDEFINALAQARYKADRTANLMRQMTAEPKPFKSTIDRQGLLELSRLARDSAARFDA